MKNIKTRHIIALFLALVIMISTLTSCSKPTDTGITNDDRYSNMSFWEKENELIFVTSGTSLTNIPIAEPEFSEAQVSQISQKQQKLIDELREEVKNYFIEFYSIDLSDKLAQQTVSVFMSDQVAATTMGYVEPTNPNQLNLNALLFTEEYSYLLPNSYIHESLHQLGFINQSEKILIEGITDAFTDLILTHNGRESYTSPYYFDARTLAYQMIMVDKQIPELYFTSSKEVSLMGKINEALAQLPRKYESCDNPGEVLEILLEVLHADTLGYLDCKNDPLIYAYEAQEIVRAYAQSQSPNEDQISYIRSHYLVENFENFQFEPSGDGGYTYTV